MLFKPYLQALTKYLPAVAPSAISPTTIWLPLMAQHTCPTQAIQSRCLQALETFRFLSLSLVMRLCTFRQQLEGREFPTLTTKLTLISVDMSKSSPTPAIHSFNNLKSLDMHLLLSERATSSPMIRCCQASTLRAPTARLSRYKL